MKSDNIVTREMYRIRGGESQIYFSGIMKSDNIITREMSRIRGGESQIYISRFLALSDFKTRGMSYKGWGIADLLLSRNEMGQYHVGNQNTDNISTVADNISNDADNWGSVPLLGEGLRTVQM